jgi:hypothetical protein
MTGTAPTQKQTLRTAVAVDAATGLLWQAGCAGPQVTRGYFNVSEVEANFPAWQKANAAWGARAARGPGVRGGPKGTATSYFYTGAFAPFGRTWGAPFAPRTLCPLYTPPPPTCGTFGFPTPTPGLPTPTCIPIPFPTPNPSGGPVHSPKPH